MKNKTISVRFHISLEDIENLIYSAQEGSKYWCDSEELGYEKPVKNMLYEKVEHMIALHDIEEDDIIENPLSREQVIDVIDLLDKYYDCSYGITWDTIDNTLDDIELPSLESCRVKKVAE